MIVARLAEFPSGTFRKDDFVAARNKVTKALWLWLAVLIAETTALLLSLKWWRG